LIRHKNESAHAQPQGKSNRYIRIVGIKKSIAGWRRWRARSVAGSLLLAFLACDLFSQPSKQPTPEQQQNNLASFEAVWSTIRDKHWDTNPGGLNWQAIHAEFRPRVEQAATPDAAREVMREMLGRLHQTHFAIFPSPVYQTLEAEAGGDGWPGFETRVLEGRVIVTDTSGMADSRAVKPGWEVNAVDGVALPPIVEKLKTDASIHELQLERAVTGRLTGPVGAKKRYSVTARDSAMGIDLTLRPPRGELAGFGNLPPQAVWFESKKLANTGYIRFNLFLDLTRLMPQFGDAVQQCARCDGIIIDLRGNPGGIGAMAMGMAGWLVDKPGQRLGTMYMRGATLNFVILPRPEAYTGPVAVLVDGSSASTSEIFAGGLKDLRRARVFGTRTAGAALPSVITRLPNGDGFQYAVANYISEGGQALEANGVIPDEEVKLTRETLLAGHDAVVDAALDWVRKQKGRK
jgi:carboxyl-terminal processing protease